MTDVAPAPAAGAPIGPLRTVADLMTRDVLTASASDTIGATCERMLGRSGGKVGSVVVTDGDRTIGILTERDLVRAAAAGVDLSTAKVAEWMTPDPDTVRPDMELSAAYISLVEHG